MRAAVRLRTHAIGNYTRPETDAPRTIFALALIAAAGVTLPWAEGIAWSRRGWSYEHGLVALAAAAASAIVSALRLFGAIDRRRSYQLGFACALLGLGSTLVFYFDIIGSMDPTTALVSLFNPATTRGAIGLYVSMAGFLGQIGVLAWHLDFVVQRRMKLALESSWTTAILVAVAATGVMLPWQRDLRYGERGWSFNEGLVALVAAAEVAIVCGLRLSGRIRLLPYAIVGLLCATVGFSAVVWFHVNMVHEMDLTGYPLLVWWLNAPRSEAGLEESLSAAGFIAMIVVLSWQLWQGRRTAD